MKMNIAHEKDHRRLPVSSVGPIIIGGLPDFSVFHRLEGQLPRIETEDLFPDIMMINTLTSDPAVALELGRRMAANAKRQPRPHNRLGAAWNRLFSERGPVVKRVGTRH